ncbi:hypothetical protein DFQ30_004197, partial [Apophysomyces sp. BC1015]
DLTKSSASQIAYSYLYEDVAGGEPNWPTSVDNTSLGLLLAVVEIRDFLIPLMPDRCTLDALSERPGMCIPVLYAILKEYEKEHQQCRDKDSKTLPRLFSLAPQPSLHFRFVTVNTKSLKALLHIRSNTDDYDGNLQIFNRVFDLDKYGFRKSV